MASRKGGKARAGRVTSQAAAEARATDKELDFASEYRYVLGDLKRIAILAAGMFAVWLLGASSAPGVLASRELAPVRVGAAVLATVLTMIGLPLLKASHPPAAATMLLFALGGFEPNARSVGIVVVGVLIVAALGEGVRYVRLRWLPAPSG